MSFILPFCREAVSSGSQFLNSPKIKEGIKDSVGFVSLAFGALAAYDLCHIMMGRKISTENDQADPKWLQIANKVSLLAAKFSLVLSAIASRQGVQIISFLMHLAVSKEQIQGVFGPNTIYAINPLHPRHVVSLAAAALAIPLITLTIYKVAIRTFPARNQSADGLSDRKVKSMTFFNFITSRPVLHDVNRLARFICSRQIA